MGRFIAGDCLIRANGEMGELVARKLHDNLRKPQLENRLECDQACESVIVALLSG